MPDFARLAIGLLEHPKREPGSESNPSAMCLALLLALREEGYQVQHFHWRSCFPRQDMALPVTGLASRHLDSWLMPQGVCVELFAHNAGAADISVIEGELQAGRRAQGATGSSLWELADWLAVPVVAVIRAEEKGAFHLPTLPRAVDAVLVDGLVSNDDLQVARSTVENLWKVPVLGGLEPLSEVRAKLAKVPFGRHPPLHVFDPLVASFRKFARLDELVGLAQTQAIAEVPQQVFVHRPAGPPPRIAVAFDEVFNCYFPDTLDVLEYLGAEVVDFSPLSDERLPEGADIVYMGCGHPERFARELAANQCMAAALRQHVCSGRRLYAEGGGLAYLCQHLRVSGDECWPMVGVFPAEAVRIEHRSPPAPVELTAECDTWLAPAGHRLRGYRNNGWQIVPKPKVMGCLASGEDYCEVIVRHHAIGSRVHLNFAALPGVLDGFLHGHAPSLSPLRQQEV